MAARTLDRKEEKNIFYYGTRLSENISRREPEGYLLCLNVPVARTGTQEYLPQELGLPPGEYPRDALVPVFRPEEEVFSPETLASFEGMPVTNDHPRDGVDLENIRRLQAGHAHNIRRGTGEESDLLLADLIITDPVLIDAILRGKREISCGYTYTLSEEDGRFVQRKIRGNHIAVVDAGRAGSRVSIKDHKSERRNAPMKNTKTLKTRKPLLKLLARAAMDGEETAAEVLEELLEETPAAPAAPAADPAVTLEVPEGREVTVDEESLSAVTERLDTLIALLSALLPPAADEDPEAPEDPDAPGTHEETGEIAEIIGEVLEEAADPEASITLEEKETPSARDALRAAVMTFRPVLGQMTPAQRRKAGRDLERNLKKVRSSGDRNPYAALAAAGGKRRPGDFQDLGRKIMAKHNVNYRK